MKVRLIAVSLLAALSFVGTQVPHASAATNMVTVNATQESTGKAVKVQVNAQQLKALTVTNFKHGTVSVPVEGLALHLSNAGFLPGTGCWAYKEWYAANDAVGAEVWRTTMQKVACGDFAFPYVNQIVQAPTATWQPNIKGVGGIGTPGWSDEGVVSTNTNLAGFYYSCCGVSGRAGTGSYATEKMDLSETIPFVGKVHLQTKYPHVWINIHWDGNVVAGADNAGTER